MLDVGPQQRFYLGLVALVLVLVQGLSSILWYVYKVNREDKDLINKDHDPTGSAILNRGLREWYFEKIRIFETFFIKHNVTPNALTCAGCCFSLVAALSYSVGLISAAGWFVLISGTFDIFDGVIARKTGKTTKSGAFFDSVLDRYAETVVYAGLMVYYWRAANHWMFWITFAAIAGAQMVSYTRAKAESIGIKGKVGIMQRPERMVFLGFGSMFSSQFNAILAPWIPQRQYLLMATLVFIAVLSNWTAIKRLQHGFLELKRAGI